MCGLAFGGAVRRKKVNEFNETLLTISNKKKLGYSSYFCFSEMLSDWLAFVNSCAKRIIE